MGCSLASHSSDCCNQQRVLLCLLVQLAASSALPFCQNPDDFLGVQSFSVLENAALDVSEDINLDDATHVRWTFNEPVQPAESGTLSFIATLR